MHPFDPNTFLYDGAHVGGVDLSDQILAPVEAIDTRFERIVFSGGTWRRWVLERCRVIGCDLSNLSFGDSALEGVRFEGCKLVGVNFQSARQMAFDAEFVGCSLRLARFGDFMVRGTIFEECDLRDADFSGADCRGVRFVDCDLSGALFDRTDLRKADLSTARGVALDPSANRIAGARINPAVAMDLARRQGFVVV